MNKRFYLLLLTLVTILWGCYRDDLCFYHPEGALIELKIDWSQAKLHPNSATAMIYKDGVYYRKEVFSAHPPVQKNIFLPIGKYSIVVFNEQVSDYEQSLFFTGLNRWELFEARTVDDLLANFYSRPSTRSLKAEVDTLAVDRIIDFVVTPEMIPESHTDPTPFGQTVYSQPAQTIHFLPKRTFTVVEVLLKVKNGIGYYFTQRNPAILQGMSESYFPGTDNYSVHTVSQAIKFIQLPRINNDTVISISSVQVVGLRDYHDPLLSPGSLEYRITLPFTYSGGITTKDYDLRTQAKKFIYTPRYTTNRPYNHLYIEIEIGLDPLVNVGGMNANIEDWTEVDIPLDGPQRLHFLANNGSKETAWWPCTPGNTVKLIDPFFITPVPNLIFREWNSQSDGMGISFQSGDDYVMKRGGAIFYAIWDRTDLPERTLYFIANDGSGNELTAKRRPGLLIPIPDNMFVHPAGKQFKEWNSNAGGTGISYLPGVSFRMKDEDTRFYAIWK